MNVAEIMTMHGQTVVVMSRTFQKPSLIQSSVDVISDRGVRCSDNQYKFSLKISTWRRNFLKITILIKIFRKISI